MYIYIYIIYTYIVFTYLVSRADLDLPWDLVVPDSRSLRPVHPGPAVQGGRGNLLDPEGTIYMLEVEC